MTYRTIHLRNKICSLCPLAVALLERLRIAFYYLPSIHRDGQRLPLPYLLKRGIIARIALRSGSKVLVETGTYMGDTPWQLRHLFHQVWSVEVHPPLAELARARFKNDPKVKIVQADSRHALKDIVPQLKEGALFWLDGHYSGGITGMGEAVCPIFEELETVFARTKVPFVVLIDDARLFGKEDGYPTIEELKNYLNRLPQPPIMWIESDIVFVIPKDHPLAADCEYLPFDAVASLLY